ncbi:hypothetical protein [Acidovorax sp. Root219]|uniref:hypothetical protein n=1 Tax=Acidovorax sp. Root219 TaxID=1736493 RepID=UPI0012F98BF6|nr:hypothetical protein [Acidovorax sp. Root219]
MLDLAKRDARVHQYAMDWKKDAPEAAMQLQALRDAGFAGSELTAQYEALAIEEGLAVAAEELRGRMQAGLRLGEQVRVLAGWLASVADRMGMNRLADAIRAMTYSEAERFVIRAIATRERQAARWRTLAGHGSAPAAHKLRKPVLQLFSRSQPTQCRCKSSATAR